MANDGTKAAPPPRTLDVQKFADSRASELGSLHSIIADRLNNDFRSRRNKRRRTTGYDDRIGRNKSRKKRRLGMAYKTNDSSLQEGQKKIPRHVRRRLELQKNPETGYSVSGDGTRRLRTHVWHAKRFTMAKLWGYHLPLGLPGRGKGSRSVLKKFRHGVLIHDTSYYSAVQLEGAEDSLLSMLRTVLVTSASVHSGDVASSVLSGATYGSAFLHHVGAPVSEPIAPVTYMWRPYSQQSRNVEADNQDVNQNEQQQTEPYSSFRRLWVWLHASVFSEGYNALTFASQKQNAETGCLIHCSSLEGQLARLEVLGQKAFQLLKKILHPVASVPETYTPLKRCSVEGTEVELKNSFLIENENNISSHSIISLSVNDPRSSPMNASEIVPVEASTDPVKEKEAIEYSAFTGNPSNRDSLPSLYFNSESNITVSDSRELWDSGNGVSPPVEESVLCMEKHYQRLDSFCLNYKNSETMNSSRKGKCSRSCPLFLLKYCDQKGAPIGWSIILPLSWTKTFWVPLVNNGAHAIGLTERHWIACEVGLPSFPADFPDCKEYSMFMASQAAAFDEKLKLRPPNKRPFRIPIPPPWGSIRLSFESAVNNVGETSHLQSPCSEDDRKLLTRSDDMSFKGFIARKADMLTQFLNENYCDNLLLFPVQPDKKTGLLKFMKNEGKFPQGLDWAAKKTNERKLCFLRVHLRAWKEGVFEEGAVVCAPHCTDIISFVSRSGDNEGGLQIPQSSVQSYFKELPSGKWDFQALDPDDSVAQESHRWPIGFVTTGFVRGSKKPVAGAMCEATLLARLREEQWNETPVRRRREEVYILVRNLRSTAYRLALATIVLEQHHEDVEFL